MTHASAMTFVRRATWLLFAMALVGCSTTMDRRNAHGEQSWSTARQLVLITTADWNADHGLLRRFSRRGSQWQEVGSASPVVVGRAGIGWGIGLHPDRIDGPVKREGDGRAPAGIFRIGEAFGYADAADTALPYVAMQAWSYCIDVPASPLYNQIVDAREVGKQAVEGSTEPMRRDLHLDGDQRYRLGFTIAHNPRATPGGGSCIFAHVWKSASTPTAGCTAMDALVMTELLGWLRPEDEPVFVLLPESELDRLGVEWDLPSPR